MENNGSAIREEFKNKKEEILSKFTKDFVDAKYAQDAVFHRIVELLIRDIDPYTIIEHLIKERKNLTDEIWKLQDR